MGKIVRMADIAARLGVSTVTVSKALGDQKGVSEELRERIKQMAGEMGYKAPSANRSEEKKSYNIGVLVAEIYIEKYATFYWELYQKITTAAVKEDCFVLLEVLESAAEKELQDIKLIRENKIDGLIVLGSVSTEYLEQLCRGNDLPIVCMDFYDNKVKVDCVISNSFYGAYQLTNYLFGQRTSKDCLCGDTACHRQHYGPLPGLSEVAYGAWSGGGKKMGLSLTGMRAESALIILPFPGKCPQPLYVTVT